MTPRRAQPRGPLEPEVEYQSSQWIDLEEAFVAHRPHSPASESSRQGLPMHKFLALEWLSLDMDPARIQMIESHLHSNSPKLVSVAGAQRKLLQDQSIATTGIQLQAPTVRGAVRVSVSSLPPPGGPAQTRQSMLSALPGWQFGPACSTPYLRVGKGGQMQWTAVRNSSSATCWHYGAEYTCFPAPFSAAGGSTEPHLSPMKGCLPWDVSGHFCNPRSLLCKRRHSFLLSLHLKAWERASQIVARGLGSQSTSHHFQDLLALGKGKDDLEAAKEEEARTTASLSCSVSQVCLDIVAPAFHSPKELNPSSSTSLPRDPMSRGRAQCCVQNRTYECVAAPGNFNVYAQYNLSPSRVCMDGSASSRVCGHGIFLCQADSKARYPWVIDPLAWYQFSESIRGEFHTKVPQETVVEIVPSDSVETTQGSPVEDDLKFVDGQTGEMLADRDPDTGERFPNILALREAKLRDW
eukprot:CAMPEP_0113730450 /NCGR_PEP_ID=MMETSP0038_2-20120614/43166_1 /TAXON_ID=2898 /ORGANISM="Cryptomonas paramecium" /LENGTH=465 /DNA_ID=CAMNT_0000662513 /DNA_START=1218 /DNA_END=2612 /DNA_ORIENTATION=- /assembly_acc=CAM_ASM_000170